MSLASVINLNPSVLGGDAYDTTISSTALNLDWTPTSAINNTNVNVYNGSSSITPIKTLSAGLYLITGSCNIGTTQIVPSTSAQSLTKIQVSFINTTTSAVLAQQTYSVTPSSQNFPSGFYLNLSTILDLPASTPVGFIVNANCSSWAGSAILNSPEQFFQVIQLGN